VIKTTESSKATTLFSTFHATLHRMANACISGRNTRRYQISCRRFIQLLFLLAAAVSAISGHRQTFVRVHNQPQISSALSWNIEAGSYDEKIALRIASFPRGGSDTDVEGGESDEYDDEVEEDEYDDESDEGDDDEKVVPIEISIEKYDEPLVASPMINLYASFGVMMLARRIDLFNPIVVRVARYVHKSPTGPYHLTLYLNMLSFDSLSAMFIAYLVLHQLFVLYVRIQAKSADDRTPITLKNPLTSVLQRQLGGGDEKGMIKNLASSFLTSETTVLEYDLRQARSMQSGLVMNMLFMWFLHFKMEQVQPLLIQSVTGFVQMIYSPLFQAYVMGRNLQRPFKNPSMQKMDDTTAGTSGDASDNDQEEESNDAISTETNVKEEEMSDEESDGETSDDETDEETSDDETDGGASDIEADGTTRQSDAEAADDSAPDSEEEEDD
jgi:hypothetical protein